MLTHDIVVVGASAGGVVALRQLAEALPADLPAAVLIVLHLSPGAPSQLASILNRSGRLPAVNAEHGSPLKPGCIYVAVPDHHLLVEQGRMLLVRGPKENRHRPAIDPLFRSAALAYGPRVIGIVLTGLLDDGTLGLWHVKEAGGLAVVQDPADAEHSGMPQNALDNVAVDHCESLAALGTHLPEWVRLRAGRPPKRLDRGLMQIENRIAQMKDDIDDIHKLGVPSDFTCPECEGSLFRMKGRHTASYRCRVGHAYGEATLAADQAAAAEASLWAAMRALREKSELLLQRARRFAPGNPQHRQFIALSKTAAGHAAQIRAMIEKNQPPFENSRLMKRPSELATAAKGRKA